jgi:hypothetical protein
MPSGRFHPRPQFLRAEWLSLDGEWDPDDLRRDGVPSRRHGVTSMGRNLPVRSGLPLTSCLLWSIKLVRNSFEATSRQRLSLP